MGVDFFNLFVSQLRWVVNLTSRALCPHKRNPVPAAQEARWALPPIWTVLDTRPAHDLAANRLRYPTAQRGASQSALFFTVNLQPTVTQINSYGEWTPTFFWADQAAHKAVQLKAKFNYCTRQQASAHLPLKLHNGVWRASEYVRRLLVLRLFPKLKH